LRRKTSGARPTHKPARAALAETANDFLMEWKNHTGRADQLPAPVAHRIEKAFLENIVRPQTFHRPPKDSTRILLKSKKFVNVIAKINVRHLRNKDGLE
jgi:hypothetical protein